MSKDSQVQKPEAGKPPGAGAAAPDTSGAHVQGEGDYESARRYDEHVEKFVQTADIERAAHEAAPRDAEEAAEMEAAERAGRARAKEPSGKEKSR